MKNLVLIIAAMLAGFTGGILSQKVSHISARTRDVTVQATRFEVVDRTGNVLASWGKDNNDNLFLGFRQLRTPPRPNSDLLLLGVRSDGSPIMQLTGSDGQPRAALSLTIFEKPVLQLGDGKNTRILLGHASTDAPQQTDDDWALSFYRAKSIEASSASIGLLGLPKSGETGYVELNGHPFVTSLSTGR
jgi:hypothetical protein